MGTACLHSVLILLSSSDRYNINIVIQNYNLHCEITGSHRVYYEMTSCDISNLLIRYQHTIRSRFLRNFGPSDCLPNCITFHKAIIFIILHIG